MVQIKIKGINNNYHVFAAFDDFTAFLPALSQRLKQCSASHTSTLSAFFHVPGIDSAQLLEILQVCEQCHVLMLGCNATQTKPQIHVVKKTLYNGSRTQLHKDTLLLGSIEQQAYVSSSASLYVLGEAGGSIDLLHTHCHLYASSLQANVRICDSRFQNLTSFSPVEVYYEHCAVKLKQLKEERMWEKQ